MIQSRRQSGEKGNRKTWLCTVGPKIHIKIWLNPLNLPTIPFIYPKILKAFPQTFLPDINPTNKYPAQEKKWGKKSERRGEERKKEENSVDCRFTFKIISKFCLLRMPVVQKLLFCIWRRVRRPQSVVSSLLSQTLTRKQLNYVASKNFFFLAIKIHSRVQ